MPNPVQPATRRPFNDITYPAGQQVVLIRKTNPTDLSGKMTVMYTRSDSRIIHAYAAVRPPNTPSPFQSGKPRPSDAVELTDPDGSGRLQSTQVQVANLPMGPPPPVVPAPLSEAPPTNYLVFVGGYDGNNNFINSTPGVAFVGMPSTVYYPVSAKHCIWQVYANVNTPHVLPANDSVAVQYIPIPLYLPDGATGVQVTPTNSADRWEHCSGCASGPAGLAGTDQPLDPGYPQYQNDPVLNSSAIASRKFPLNRLVGLWVYSDPTIPTTEFDAMQSIAWPPPVGPQPSNLPPISLVLAFHDGYQWSNNGGVVNVQVNWQYT